MYDQGNLGSCTANRIAAAIEFDQRKQGVTTFVASRLFIYYNERAIEGHVNQDSGAQIRDGVKVVSPLGAPPESECPYDIARFADKPKPAVYAEAKKDLLSMYSRVPQSLTQLQGCLADGFPFVFGFTVYDSFESQAVAQTGMVPMPGPGETVLGGYCMMPHEYVINAQLASDFWTIRSVKTHR